MAAHFLSLVLFAVYRVSMQGCTTTAMLTFRAWAVVAVLKLHVQR